MTSFPAATGALPLKGGAPGFLMFLVILSLLWAGPAHAEDAVSCRGNITSKQGEGLVVKTFRFEVSGITGSDVNAVLEICKKVARERQNKAGRANPALAFRKFSDVELDCTRGGERFAIRRTLQTAP
jgi:hypothetical protein